MCMYNIWEEREGGGTDREVGVGEEKGKEKGRFGIIVY